MNSESTAGKLLEMEVCMRHFVLMSCLSSELKPGNAHSFRQEQYGIWARKIANNTRPRANDLVEHNGKEHAVCALWLRFHERTTASPIACGVLPQIPFDDRWTQNGLTGGPLFIPEK